MNHSIKQAYDSFGLLRLSLIGLVLANAIYALLRSMLASPAAAEHSAKWMENLAVIVPTLAPLLLVGIFFDYLMSKVRAADAEGDLRAQFLLISRVELWAMLFLILSWIPFFVTLY